MARETYTSQWEQNILIRQVEGLKKGVEITVFKAEEAIAKGIKREKETKPVEEKRHKHHVEAKKQMVKHK